MWWTLALLSAGAVPPEPSEALTSEAAALAEAGRFAEAVERGQAALALQETRVGPNAPEVAETRRALGVWMHQAGDLNGALDHQLAWLAHLEGQPETDRGVLASTRLNLGRLLRSLGRLDEARIQIDAGVALRRDLEAAPNRELATALNDQANLLSDLGDNRAARALGEQALEMRIALLGPDDVDVGLSHNDLAGTLTELNDGPAARRHYERAHAILEAHYGAAHPHVAMVASNLGRQLVDHDLVAALHWMEQAETSLIESLGPDHPAVAAASTNLALLSMELWDVQDAIPRLERALEIAKRADPDGTGLKATVALANLARALYLAGEEIRSVALLVQALGQMEEAVGPQHAYVATLLHNLSSVHLYHGSHAQAEVVVRRALAIREATLGPAHPEIAESLDNLGHAVLGQDETAGALAIFERAVALVVAARGEEHTQTAFALQSLAQAVQASGDIERARALRDRALGIQHRFLDEIMGALGERQSLQLMQRTRRHLDHWLDVHDRPEDSRVAWGHLLEWKGRVARSLTARRHGASPQGAQVVDALAETRRSLARLAYAPWDAAQVEARRAEIASLRARREALEREAAAFTPRRASASPDAVCRHRSDDTALVDILRIRDPNRRLRYIAYVVPAGSCDPVRVELGPAPALEAEVAAWREVMSQRNEAGTAALTSRVDRRGRAVHDRVWSPLVAALGPAARVVVAPDAALALVPLGALPTAEGRYLVEDFVISYVDAAADLAMPPAEAGVGALLVGDVAFSAGGSARPGRTSPCADRAWTALPGTRRELDTVAALWRKRRRDEPIQILDGARASVDAVTAAMGSHRVVHLATHGYFADEGCAGHETAVELLPGTHPMLLSGLVLAGEPGTGPGILTAEEVEALDLSGTELVVLSACETGLGTPRTGDGVQGLRRAFAVAGARNTVMSLWSVPDAATADLMASLYEGVLRKRSDGPAAALARAQRKHLASNRRVHGDARPQDWGAFVVSGRD